MGRYNLGCGSNYLEGLVNVDRWDKDNDGNEIKVDFLYDLSEFPWPFPDGRARQIFASHILEHFSKKKAYQFLHECHRMLKPGGVLHLAVPDMDLFIEGHLTGDWSKVDGYRWTDLNHLLGGDATEPRDWMRHKYMYNFETLAYMLEEIGYTAYRRMNPLAFDLEDYHAFSLYVDGVKI